MKAKSCRHCGIPFDYTERGQCYCSLTCRKTASLVRGRHLWNTKYKHELKHIARRRSYYLLHRERILVKSAKWYKENRARVVDKRRRWELAQYGLSLEQFEEMVRACKGRCELCGSVPTRRVLSVDHDHATNEVRGLLCEPCNRGLGLFRDSPDVMRKAIAYLERRPREARTD